MSEPNVMRTQQTNYEACVPFSGFYNSLWDGEIDSQEGQAVEYMRSEFHDGNYSGLEPNKVWEVLNRHADYRAMYRKIAELYVDAWADLVNDELDLDIQLGFSIMTSPREYNFTTDRVFANISRDDIAKVYKKVGRQRLRDKAEEMFTSRDGFISSYSPRIKEWGPVRAWDYNQLGCLMAALYDMVECPEGCDLTIYYRIYEGIGEAYQENVDWEAVERDLQHLVDIESGEAREILGSYSGNLMRGR